MKKLLLITLAFTMSYTINAQIQTPAPSPFAKVEQVVGLTDVSIEYSRPSVKGRVIFGDLVPYGKVWRTGANASTKITFSNDVTVDGQTLKKGTYAIFVKPEAESWEVMFYTDYSGGGVPEDWDDTKVAARKTVKTSALPFSIESFSIGINDLTNNGATLNMYWDKTSISVPFSVPTDEAVVASIEKAMAGPGRNDYYAAAVYYLDAGKDINQARKWIDKAISMNEKPPFWQLRQQSLIHAAAGDKESAIKVAKASLAASEAAGNADYIKMNKDSLKEWGAQ